MGKGNLIPFSPTLETTQAGIVLVGESRLQGSSLVLTFHLSARDPNFLKALVPSAQEVGGLRRDELWKTTCFEAFIAKPGSEGYVEFNGTLNGEWNLYEFDSYRSGMRPVVLGETSPPKLIKREIHDQEWRLSFEIPLALLKGEVGPLGMTAVLKRGEEITYWALKHAGAKPDFHLRESFCDDPVRN